MARIMSGERLLDIFTPVDLSNFGDIVPQWLDVPFGPGRHSAIPCQWGFTSFSVNRDVCKGAINALSIIFDPPEDLKGRINMLDSQREVLVLGPICLGIPQCSQDRSS